jgi:hypothetical protein
VRAGRSTTCATAGEWRASFWTRRSRRRRLVPAEVRALKGPKCEIFGFGFFALIRPIWIGDLGTRPKNYKF